MTEDDLRQTTDKKKEKIIESLFPFLSSSSFFLRNALVFFCTSTHTHTRALSISILSLECLVFFCACLEETFF